MAYPSDRVIVFDRDGAFVKEISPADLFSRLRVEEINGEHELTLVTTSVLDEGMRVLTCDDTGKRREYVVYRPDRAHERGEHAIGTYVCMWSLQYDLMGAYSMEVAEPGMGSVCSGSAALDAALQGQTRWEVGITDVATVARGKGCVMVGISAWERLKLVVQHWNGEVDARIVVDDTGVVHRYVDLYAHLGSIDAIRRFGWGADLKSIKRIPDPGPYYSRIVPLGRGQREYAEDDTTEFDWPIDITEETGGVPYVADADADLVFRMKNPDGTYFYPTKMVEYDEDDPELLLNAALEDLHNHTRPNVQYEADVLQFSRAGMDVHGVSLGDNVQCSDYGFDAGHALAIEGRVQRMEVEELQPETHTVLTIGSLGTTWANTLRDVIGSNMKSISDHLKNIEQGGTLAYLESLIDNLNDAINALGGYTYIVPGEGIITYDHEVADPLIGTEATSVTQIKGGAIRIANTKKSSFAGINDWNWRTLIVSGHVASELVTAVQITAGFIGDATQGCYWNLDNGTFEIRPTALFGDRTVADVLTVVDSTVTGVDVEYAQNQSRTIPPVEDSDAWSSTAPAWRSGYYIWQRTAITRGDDDVETTEHSTPTCISGREGTDGTDGTDGVGITSIVEQYYLSTSSTTQTGGSWSATQPTWSSGKYIWTRSKITWDTSPATTTYTDPVLANALTQANSNAKQAIEAAEDAAKVATNFMMFSTSSGLDVGYSGTNAKTRINGSGVTVYDGNGVDKLNASSSGVRIGRTGNYYRAFLDDDSFGLYGAGNVEVFHVGIVDPSSSTDIAEVISNFLFGLGLQSASDWQTVLGKYNVKDSNNKYALIVGGGSSGSSRKNIFTLDWNGSLNTGRSTRFESTNMDSAASVTGNTNLLFVDNSNEDYGAISPRVTGGGSIWGSSTKYGMRFTGGKSGSRNYIDILTDVDGTKYYELGSPAAFRSALGIAHSSNTDGWVDYTSGDGAVTVNNFAKSSFTAHKVCGRICQFYVSGRVQVDVAAGGSVILGTLPAGYRPILSVGANARSVYRRAVVGTNGNVTLATSAAISANSVVTVDCTFITAS